MALVTLDGQIGAGAPEIGRRIAAVFGFKYVDRLILPGHALAPNALPQGGTEPSRFSDRFWMAVQRAISGFAMGNAAGNPYFYAVEPPFFPLTWDVSPMGPRVSAEQFDPEDPAGRAEQDLRSLVETGKAVLVHRAGCVAAQSAPVSLSIGLFASWDDRVRRIMSREGVPDAAAAERTIRERHKAQVDYFGRFHGAHPEDQSLYDICIDTSSEHIDAGVRRISREVRLLLPQRDSPGGTCA